MPFGFDGSGYNPEVNINRAFEVVSPMPFGFDGSGYN